MRTVTLDASPEAASRHFMSKDNRSLDEGIEIKLTTPSGETCPGRVLGIDEAVVAIGMNDGGCALPIDQLTTLLVPDGPGKHLELGGRVVSRREGERHSEYGIALTDRSAWGVLSVLCNRRRAFRVRPLGVGQSMSVQLNSDGNVHGATLQDLSVTGLGVIVAPDIEVAVANMQVIEIHFGPPAFPETFTMQAKIRHRESVVAGVRYGLELIQDHSSQSVENQKRLTEYVMNRQREMLKRQRER